MVFQIGLVVLVGLGLLKMSGVGIGWSARHQLALVSGALGFFILLAPLQEMDKNRADNTTGMGIVGLVMAVFLILLFLRVRSIEKGSAGSQLSCG
jgi:asparagine N-glycosylation enzyme membrane subunit Stt3